MINIAYAQNVILSSGLENWNREQLIDQYNAFLTYTRMNIISASSILVYNLDKNGNLDTYNTSDSTITAEQYQIMIKNLDLKSYPCLFCDATIGNCANLSDRLENLYTHQQDFINSTLVRAKTYGWDGYTVDFEPDQSVDSAKLTAFIVDWANQLASINKTLYIWIGGTTYYDMSVLFNTNNIKLITMNTYVNNYDDFINIASDPLIKISNSSRLGFGLLTSELKKINPNIVYTNVCKVFNSMPQKDITNILKWSKLTNTDSVNIWASTIPPNWYKGLHIYLS